MKLLILLIDKVKARKGSSLIVVVLLVIFGCLSSLLNVAEEVDVAQHIAVGICKTHKHDDHRNKCVAETTNIVRDLLRSLE